MQFRDLRERENKTRDSRPITTVRYIQVYG